MSVNIYLKQDLGRVCHFYWGDNSIMNANEVMLNRLRVLAVGDDADSLDLLAFVLSEYGLRVLAVASASEALKIVAQ